MTSAQVAMPLQVLVFEPQSERPTEDVEISWSIVEGAGAVLASGTTMTDEDGLTSNQLRLGSLTGTYRVEARAQRMTGPPAAFTLRAVLRPEIHSVQPTIAAAGQNVTITGANFSGVPDENTVLFGGLPARVTAATTTQLTVRAPECVPSRTLQLHVGLGAVQSAAAAIAAAATTDPPLQLAPGEARHLFGPQDVACLRLPATSGAAYLIVPQNVPDAIGVAMPFELRGVTAGTLVTAPAPQPLVSARAFSPSDWELALRAREIALQQGGPESRLAPQAAPAQVAIEIGDRRGFKVLNNTQAQTTSITAEVKAISERAIIYVDLQAPATGGFTSAELEAFGRIFDDPIYPTDVAVFGQPSDIDANTKIIIVFTPKVNALTPRSEGSFIAGYFYGCDLVSASRCSDTNTGEIFYSMVPDPDAVFSGRRTKSDVLRTVPGILAHEFQHMINFARKNQSLDALWLSEGLAHVAEDLVGEVFASRGDVQTADDFRRPNQFRGQRYLAATATTSLTVGKAPGTLEMRGASWLFVTYISGHFGGTALLGRLTGSPRSGVANVTAETAQTWHDLYADFSIAIWADGAPELQGAQVQTRHTFPNLDVRRVLSQGGVFALRPRPQSFSDFVLTGALPATSQDYIFVQKSAAESIPLGIALTGLAGGNFNTFNASPQLSVLRVR